MSSMMDARAVILTFPPEIDVNPTPTGHHDMLTGGGSPFYNDLIHGLKLNISLVLATSLGRCTYDAKTRNASCDGISGKLASAAADFTLMPLSVSTYDPRITEIPVRFGPELFEAGWIFTSFPYEAAHQKRITISGTMNEIPHYYCLSIMFYFIAHLLINYSVSKGNLFTGRIKWIQMYGVMLLRPTGRVKKSYRRLIYWLCLVLSIMTFQLLMGSTSSDMVIVIPAKYYETYQEIAASNETPALIAGLSLDVNFEDAVHDPDKQVIFHRSITRGTRFSPGKNVMTNMASNMRKTVQFFDDEIQALSVIGISCYLSKFEPPIGLKESQVFDHSVGIMVYSRSIRPGLRQHVDHFFQRVLESGFYDKYRSDVRITLSSLGKLDRLTMCMMRMAMRQGHRDPAEVRPRNIRYYDDFLILSTIIIIVSLIAAVTEYSWGERRMRSINDSKLG